MVAYTPKAQPIPVTMAMVLTSNDVSFDLDAITVQPQWEVTWVGNEVHVCAIPVRMNTLRGYYITLDTVAPNTAVGTTHDSGDNVAALLASIERDSERIELVKTLAPQVFSLRVHGYRAGSGNEAVS